MLQPLCHIAGMVLQDVDVSLNEQCAVVFMAKSAMTWNHAGHRGVPFNSLVQVEIEEITNALESFKGEVAAGASVGKLPYGRLVKE
jgi:hypothetical protein